MIEGGSEGFLLFLCKPGGWKRLARLSMGFSPGMMGNQSLGYGYLEAALGTT